MTHTPQTLLRTVDSILLDAATELNALANDCDGPERDTLLALAFNVRRATEIAAHAGRLMEDAAPVPVRKFANARGVDWMRLVVGGAVRS